MQIRINEDKFKKEYRFDKGEIKHNSGKNIKLLPYKSKYEKKHEEQIKNFNRCLGEFCRLSYNKKMARDEIDLSNIDFLLDEVESNINDKLVLKSIIKEIFFDRDENINPFHPRLLNYIDTPKGDWNVSLAEFLYDVLLNDDKDSITIKDKMKKIFDSSSDNILELLILKNLPSLYECSKKEFTYKCVCQKVSNLFKKDLNFMLDNIELFKDEFENLLKYYYFFYVSQFTIKMSKLFDTKRDDIEKIYFTLDWESVSISRTSYILGWKMLESNIYKLFSHINTLEILNTNDNKDKYDYIDIDSIISNLPKHEKNILYQNIINTCCAS